MYYVIPCFLSIFMMLNKNKKAINIAFVLFSIFFVLRFPMGQDIPGYIYLLQNSPTVPTLGEGRFIFIDLYFSIFNTLFKNPTVYLFFVSTLSCLIIFKTFKDESVNLGLSCFLFTTTGFAQVYLQSGIRQGLAMAVLLFAFYKFLMKDKYWKFALCILLVATYHDISLLMLLLIPIKKYSGFFTNKIIIILMTTSLAVGLVIFPIIIPYFSFIGWYYEYLSSYSISIAGIGLQVIQFLIVCTLYHFTPNKNDINKRIPFIINCASLSLYLLFIGYPLISRVCDFLHILNFIYIPFLLVDIMKNRVGEFLTVTLLFLNLFLLFTDLQSSINAMEPASNINILNYPYNISFIYDYEDIFDVY